MANPCWQILTGIFGKASLAKPRGQILPDNFGGQTSLVKPYWQNLIGKFLLAKPVGKFLLVEPIRQILIG